MAVPERGIVGAGFPLLVAARLTLASPKSRTLACPRLVTKMFAGLISRWMMPAAWAASSASAISMATDSSESGVQRTSGDAVLQRHAVQILHDDERLPVLLADVVDGADVGMVQGGCGACFPPKARERLRVLGQFFGKKLQGDEAVQPRVLGLIDHAHPAAAQLLDDAVVRDGLADHWPRILRR